MEAYYQHHPTYPIYGTGQGCSNSLTVWCIVSSTLFKAHQDTANGATFSSPDKSQTTSFSMVGFVDDSTGRANKFEQRPQPTAIQLTQLMSEDAQHWHDALDFSGGKLELPKCSYHLLTYQFQPDGSAKPVKMLDLPDIRVHNNRESVAINRMSVYKSHKTLGHWKSPAGQGQTNLSKVKQKALKTAQQINVSNLSRSMIWLMYLSIYTSAIEYTLPQSHYKLKELDNAQKQSMHILIGKCRYNRNTPLSVLYGPTHLGGAGFVAWKTLQGEGQLITFIQHWRTTTKIGIMLQIAVAWAQLFAGTSKLLLNDQERYLDYVPAKWLLSIREFLSLIQGTLNIHQSISYPKQRQGDQLLMDIAHDSNIFTSHQLECINQCRLYLQVRTVSDITNKAGTHLQSGAYHGPPTTLYSQARWLFPVQSKPHHQVWTYWLKFLNLIANHGYKLHQPLGQWLLPANQLARTWIEYRHKDGDQHFVQQLTNPTQWLVLTRHRKTWHPSHIISNPPFPDLFPCDRTNNMAVSLHLYPPTSRPVAPSTFHDFVQQQSPAIQQFLAQIDLHFDPYTILELLNNKDTNYLTTDGALLPLRTAYSWVLALDDQHILAEGCRPAAGASTSYRAKAYGMHAGVLMLSLLCQFTQQQFPQLDILCDNQSLINKAAKRCEYQQPFPTSNTEAEWDQIKATHQILQSLNLEINFIHVKGHQDESGHELDFQARMNIQADYLTGTYIYNNITPH